ncbi:MAG: alpha-galactosidase [Deltaproteobacteria bacterium]|nr:alpha-galactosidase [Deltaproteobacteria bacterium]
MSLTDARLGTSSRLVVLLIGAPLTAACSEGAPGAGPAEPPGVVTSALSGRVMVFNGIPRALGWGEDFIYEATAETQDTRSLGVPPLGGMPLVDIWNEQGGVALFNMAQSYEPFTVQLEVGADAQVTIRASGASGIVKLPHQGDCFEALREFARRWQDRGVGVQPAPPWAFDPIWETYGFEESWSPDAVLSLVPLLQELGVGTVTLDSGWYGSGSQDWQALAGDFPVNPDVVGTEQDLEDLVQALHDEGFRVRVWWTPGVAEHDTALFAAHPDWFGAHVTPSWGEPEQSGDYYLDPKLPAVRQWNRALVERLVGYGVDGFKQDDVYEIDSENPEDHRQYSALFRDTYETAAKLRPDFAINTCNCGVAQNFFDFPGENQLIISDPVGARQLRTRAKYLRALNVNGAAVLGDHIELTQGDVGAADLATAGFYDAIGDADFASVVALGMVLESKLTRDPGPRYRRWFQLYRDLQLYRMEWINIPYFSWAPLESYLMRDGSELYFSFFAPDAGAFDGAVPLSHLEPGTTYAVRDVVGDTDLAPVTADAQSAPYEVSFTASLLIRLSPKP